MGFGKDVTQDYQMCDFCHKNMTNDRIKVDGEDKYYTCPRCVSKCFDKEPKVKGW